MSSLPGFTQQWEGVLHNLTLSKILCTIVALLLLARHSAPLVVLVQHSYYSSMLFIVSGPDLEKNVFRVDLHYAGILAL